MHRVLALLLLAAPAAAQVPAPVVAPLGPARVAGALRAEAVAVDVARLDAAARGRDAVALELLGAALVVRPERVERRGAGRYTVFGAVDGGGRAVLTVEGAHLVAHVVTARGTLRVEPRGGGHVAVEPAEPPETPDDWIAPPAPTPGARAGGADPLFPDEIHLAVFTSSAVADSVGAAVPAVVQSFVDALNDVLANSRVPATARLVLSRPAADPESGSMVTDLFALSNPEDGVMDGVHGLRDAYSADLVALITETGPDACGIAFLIAPMIPEFEDAGFSVTRRVCGPLVFAHEIGHNLGLHHDRYVVPGGGGASQPFAFGFVNTDSLDAAAGRPGLRTVLSYNQRCRDLGGTCTRIPFFSTPDTLWNGQAIGAAGTEDNALAARLALPVVSGFRAPEPRGVVAGTTLGGPLALRPVCADPADLTACTLAPASGPYAEARLYTPFDGMLYVQGASDFYGVMLLYAGAFDPANPLAGLIGYAEEDPAAPAARRWLLRAPLPVEAQVTLVTTGRAPADAGPFQHTVYGPAGLGVVVAGERAPAAGGLRLTPARPNPARGRAELSLAVDAPQAVRVVLVDALGRDVAVLFDGPAAGGQTLAVEGVAPGVYTVEARGATEVASRRLTVLGGR